jgi:hypothetical protein
MDCDGMTKLPNSRRRTMDDCPNCEYHRKRAQLWREEAYKLAGHPLPDYLPTVRNDVLEEVAKEFDSMKAFGDTSASFAAYVRGLKR